LIQLENFKGPGVENSRYWQMDIGVVIDEKEQKLSKVDFKDFQINHNYKIGILDYAINNPRDNIILQKIATQIKDTNYFLKRSEYCQISFQLALRTLVQNKFSEILSNTDFIRLDDDGDHKVTREELDRIIQNRAITDELFKLKDTDNDGVLTLEELGISERNSNVRNLETNVLYEDILAETDWEELDKDKSDSITLEEFIKVIGHEATARTFFEIKDKNKDGILTREELGIPLRNDAIRDTAGNIKRTRGSILNITTGQLQNQS